MSVTKSCFGLEFLAPFWCKCQKPTYPGSTSHRDVLLNQKLTLSATFNSTTITHIQTRHKSHIKMFIHKTKILKTDIKVCMHLCNKCVYDIEIHILKSSLARCIIQVPSLQKEALHQIVQHVMSSELWKTLRMPILFIVQPFIETMFYILGCQ